MPDGDDVDLERVLARIAKLEREIATTTKDLQYKDQIIKALMQKLYGKKSERYDPNQLQFDFGEECLGKPEAGEEAGGDDNHGGKQRRNRTKKRDLLPRNIPIVVVETVIPPEVAADPEVYEQITEEYHDELEAQPGHLYYKRVVMPKYRKKDDRAKPPIISPAPESTIPGTLCGPELMAMIIADKYCDHLPHYRQSDRFLRRHGAIICRQTLNQWTHCAAKLLEPIAQVLKNQIILAEILQIDETPLDYLSPGLGKTGTGYMWVYRDQELGTTYFDWQTGRGHECLLEMLGYDEASGTLAFNGDIQCDGFSAYITLCGLIENLQLAGCLAHIRRYFYEAREQSPDLVDRILKIIQKNVPS